MEVNLIKYLILIRQSFGGNNYLCRFFSISASLCNTLIIVISQRRAEFPLRNAMFICLHKIRT